MTERPLPTQSTQETKKENNKKGQYSILHHETNISVRIYIPKEQLILNNKGTPLFIPITGIKHSMSLSYKSVPHSEV